MQRYDLYKIGVGDVSFLFDGVQHSRLAFEAKSLRSTIENVDNKHSYANWKGNKCKHKIDGRRETVA